MSVHSVRVAGRARVKLRSGEEFELELAAFEFTYATTWEPSLTVVDIHEVGIRVANQTLHLELLESQGPLGSPLSLRVRPSCPSGAELVEVSGLARLSHDPPQTPARAITPKPPMSREDRLAAYHEACESLAAELRAALPLAPERRESRVLEALARMAALPRPPGASHVEIARRLLFDTGYFETEVLALPEGLSAADLVEVMLGFGEEGRGVDLQLSEGTRRLYRTRPAELEDLSAAEVEAVHVRTQFSTRGPGGTRPGIVYERGAGGFVFDGPSAARDRARARITARLPRGASVPPDESGPA